MEGPGAALSGLIATGLEVEVDGRRILDGVDLVVPAGATCAVLGPSGSGKTTFLRALLGLVELDAGTVEVAGRDLTGVSPRRRRLAPVFQDPRLFPHLSVAENVAYALRVAGVGRGDRRGRALELLGEVGLADRADDRPAGLSGGEQQRVALARALCRDSDLLLLDEPLSAVDGPARTTLRRLIADLTTARAQTTLVVTHDLADATALGDLVAVVSAGRILQCDHPEVVMARPVCPTVAALTGNPNVVEAGVRWTARPEQLRLDTGRGEPARVVRVERRADHTSVTLASRLGTLEATVPTRRAPSPGDAVCIDIDPADVWVFPGPGSTRALLDEPAR